MTKILFFVVLFSLVAFSPSALAQDNSCATITLSSGPENVSRPGDVITVTVNRTTATPEILALELVLEKRERIEPPPLRGGAVVGVEIWTMVARGVRRNLLWDFQKGERKGTDRLFVLDPVGNLPSLEPGFLYRVRAAAAPGSANGGPIPRCYVLDVLFSIAEKE